MLELSPVKNVRSVEDRAPGSEPAPASRELGSQRPRLGRERAGPRAEDAEALDHLVRVDLPRPAPDVSG
jgi:hypothetical protein